MMRMVLSLVAVAGCAPRFPLSEVPIEGGTPEQRRLVADELADFDRWVGSGRVELRAVRFDELSRVNGRYRRGGEVLLSLDLELNDVRRVVRHELCHALDRQEGLLDHAVSAFDTLIEPFEAAGLVIAEGGRRHRRGEVFARMCENGPSVATVLQAPCLTDPDDLAPASAFLGDHVWNGDPDLVPSAPEPVDSSVPSFEGSFAPADILVLGGAGGASAHLALVDASEEPVTTVTLWVDLATGEPLEAAPAGYDTSGSYDLEPPVPLPLGLTASPASGTVLPVHTVVQGDRAAVIVHPHNGRIERALGRFAPRAVLLDGDRWHAVDACPGDVATVFSTPDRLWLAWAEGAVVQWAPVSVP